jgi:hypothetical protein
VPRQGGVGRDGELDGGELRLACGVVGVGLAVPGLGGLEEDFALAGGDMECGVLREDCG